MKKLVIYTDGACLGNPGKGGFGAVLIYNNYRKEISGGYRITTNNRMELLSVIKALEALRENCEVTLYSDSKYVVDSVNKGWVYTWYKNNFMRKTKSVPNADLWRQLLPLLERHGVTFVWVKGHAGNEGNERCDHLANTAAMGDDLIEDINYEAKPTP